MIPRPPAFDTSATRSGPATLVVSELRCARALHGVAIDRVRLHRAIGRQMQRVDELDYRLRDHWRASMSATFIACDYASGLTGLFDLIVSNPPYIRSADIDGLAAAIAFSFVGVTLLLRPSIHADQWFGGA